MFNFTPNFWIAASLIALTIGLAFLLFRIVRGGERRDSRTRDARGIWRDFLTGLGPRESGPTDERPHVLFLTRAEVHALNVCLIYCPLNRAAINGNEIALPLSWDELTDLRMATMAAAQDRIGKAARRQQVTLSGITLAIGALAGKVHNLWITSYQGHFGVAPPGAAFDSAQADPAESAGGAAIPG